MIGLLKKPLSICQSGWKEIRNVFPVIRWAVLEQGLRTLLPGLNYVSDAGYSDPGRLSFRIIMRFWETAHPLLP